MWRQVDHAHRARRVAVTGRRIGRWGAPGACDAGFEGRNVGHGGAVRHYDQRARYPRAEHLLRADSLPVGRLHLLPLHQPRIGRASGHIEGRRLFGHKLPGDVRQLGYVTHRVAGAAHAQGRLLRCVRCFVALGVRRPNLAARRLSLTSCGRPGWVLSRSTKDDRVDGHAGVRVERLLRRLRQEALPDLAELRLGDERPHRIHQRLQRRVTVQ
mmetsp:Transcript_11968/g.30627  ORF Transcript_11968/g.30627 Transcript_11968/m.30627 type:complete len:213 (-) Transcript_11968:382-1020(-)